MVPRWSRAAVSHLSKYMMAQARKDSPFISCPRCYAAATVAPSLDNHSPQKDLPFKSPRLKQEGKEGVELGQYVYEIYNHDVELRVSKAGVNLLLSKWMKELEKIFYGNIVAYDKAMLPEAKPDELPKVIWRNIFSDDGSGEPDAAASRTVHAMARYVRREVSCFSLTDKEAMFSGNFMFSSLGKMP